MNIKLTLSLFLSVLLIAACNTKNPVSGDSATVNNDSLVSVQIYDSIVTYNKYLAITAFTPFPENNDNSSSWDIINIGDTIAIGLRTDDTLGLYGRLELRKEWLCISFPDKDQNKPHAVDRLSTSGYTVDWIGDTMTIVSTGASIDTYLCYDIAFREQQKENYKYIVPRDVNDYQLALSLTAKIQRSIEEGRTAFYKNETDTVIFTGLQEVSIDGRNILLASYNSLRSTVSDSSTSGQTIFVVDGDEIYNWGTGYQTRVQFFKLRDKYYMYHEVSYYACFNAMLFRIEASKIEKVFDISKSTD